MDATDELDPEAKIRNTARISACKGQAAVLEELGALSTEHVHHGDATAIDLDSMVSEEALVPGTIRIQGGQVLASLLRSGPPTHLPPILQEVATHHPPLEWIDDLLCQVATEYAIGDGERTELVRRSQPVLGDYRAGGDFAVTLYESAVDEDGEPVHFIQDWLYLDGNLYTAERSALSGTVYPARNGSTALPRATHLRFVPAIQSWVSGPFPFLTSGAAEYAVHSSGPQSLEVEAGFRWGFSQGAEPSLVAHALFGTRWLYRVDLRGAIPRVSEMERRHFTGELATRHRYRRYAEVAPGVWRPMEVEIEEFAPGGDRVRRSTLSFSGRRRTGAPGELRVPNPVSDLWHVQTGG